MKKNSLCVCVCGKVKKTSFSHGSKVKETSLWKMWKKNIGLSGPLFRPNIFNFSIFDFLAYYVDFNALYLLSPFSELKTHFLYTKNSKKNRYFAWKIEKTKFPLRFSQNQIFEQKFEVSPPLFSYTVRWIGLKLFLWVLQSNWGAYFFSFLKMLFLRNLAAFTKLVLLKKNEKKRVFW